MASDRIAINVLQLSCHSQHFAEKITLSDYFSCSITQAFASATTFEELRTIEPARTTFEEDGAVRGPSRGQSRRASCNGL